MDSISLTSLDVIFQPEYMRGCKRNNASIRVLTTGCLGHKPLKASMLGGTDGLIRCGVTTYQRLSAARSSPITSVPEKSILVDNHEVPDHNVPVECPSFFADPNCTNRLFGFVDNMVRVRHSFLLQAQVPYNTSRIGRVLSGVVAHEAIRRKTIITPISFMRQPNCSFCV